MKGCWIVVAVLLVTTAVGCGGGDDESRARVLTAGPAYTGRCDPYTTCDGAVLAWTTATGVHVELDHGFLQVLFGVARSRSESPTWANEVVPGQDATDNFATDSGVVELPGSRGYCTISLGSRLCEPCHLRHEACDRCVVPPSFVDAWLDGKYFQWSLDLNADVGPFECETVVDRRRWLLLELRPRNWFEDVSPDMLAAQTDPIVAPGAPLYDALVARITATETFATLVGK